MSKSPELLQKRINEFLKYHRYGDGECNGILLKAYSDKLSMGENDRFDLALFYAITYSIPSALKLLRDRERINENVLEYIEKNKQKIIFQSDRRYMRCNGLFEKTMNWYVNAGDIKERFESVCLEGNTIKLDKAIQHVKKWVSFGRFASFLFIETYVYLLGRDYLNTKFDWKNGDTATSGMLNLLGLDKEASYYDKTKTIPKNISVEWLDEKLDWLLESIRATGGNDNVSCVETSLCAYRKFFKGSRYNGYYLDRQLEEINQFIKNGQELESCRILLGLRSKIFDNRYLGEIGGWNGVRKKLKRLYINTGKVS